MPTILFTWEQGGGLGHIVPMLPFVRGLVARGHRVVMALRDLSRARAVFEDDRIQLLQAPFKVGAPDYPILPSMNFAHLLHNIGFADARELGAMAEAWGNLYSMVRPDLILFDHSPTALLASRGYSCRKALLGQGFFSPPDQSPLPCLCPWLEADAQQLFRDEQRILGNMNAVLERISAPRLERITQMYAEVDENFLTIFAEMDHYPQRKNARYWGPWHQHGGAAPKWPDVRGRRIYAYLKQFPELPDLLRTLANLGQPTLVYIDALHPQVREAFSGRNLSFAQSRLNIAQVAEECDLALLNGTIGTTISMLLAGKPSLHLPIYLEQLLFTKTVVRLGAGVESRTDDPGHTSAMLSNMLQSDEFGAAARRFAGKYRGYDQEAHVEAILGRMEQILSTN